MPKFLTALCLLVLLTACGQSGALYLPDHGKPPAKHKDKPAKVVPVKPAPATGGSTAPADAAPTPAAPVTDSSATPTPAADDSTQSTPSP